jgi:hypothetical protein
MNAAFGFRFVFVALLAALFFAGRLADFFATDRFATDRFADFFADFLADFLADDFFLVAIATLPCVVRTGRASKKRSTRRPSS